MIKYILDNNLYSKEYVALYTNAPFIVGKKYGFKDGLFSDTKRHLKALPWASTTRASGPSKWTRTACPRWTAR
jgi:anaerobic selenocysteine-containing dehydrogenase